MLNKVPFLFKSQIIAVHIEDHIYSILLNKYIFTNIRMYIFEKPITCICSILSRIYTKI